MSLAGPPTWTNFRLPQLTFSGREWLEMSQRSGYGYIRTRTFKINTM